MKDLPPLYPQSNAMIETLLEWAHKPEPPYHQLRAAAPWLSDRRQMRAYLDGVIEGRIASWQYGPLFGETGQ